MDAQFLMLMNGLVGRYAVLDFLVRFFCNDYVVPTALSLMLVALWFWGSGRVDREKNQRAVLQAIVTVLLANLIVKVFNLTMFRPRPFADHAVTLYFYRPTDSSFPSNAAASGFAFASAVWLINRRAGSFMALLATLWALARAFAGVHYPLDIVAGAVIGILSEVIVWRGRRFAEPLFRLIIQAGRHLYLA